LPCDVIFDYNKSSTILNDDSEFCIDHWKNNGFDNNVGNEGTQDDLQQEGNDNVNMEDNKKKERDRRNKKKSTHSAQKHKKRKLKQKDIVR
jgi:hypothetical protein